MDVEITPEPSAEEREALLRALAGAELPGNPESAWWQAGVRESVEGDDEDQALD